MIPLMECNLLSGVRVVEVSQILAAPYVATVLGDLGADVVKLEPPIGDSMRGTDGLLDNGGSAYFSSVNRSKRFVSADLRTDEGRARFEALMKDADVFVTNIRPASRSELGIDFEQVVRLAPRITYASISGFGEAGPRAKEPGMDIIAQAVSGIMSVTGTADSGPLKAGPPIADLSAALYACVGILASLVSSRPEPRRIDVSLLDASLGLISNYVPEVSVTGNNVPPAGPGHPQLVPYRAFEDKEGRFFIVGIITDKFWARLLRALGSPPALSGAELLTNAGRVRRRDLVESEVQKSLKLRSRDEWLEILQSGGVPCCPVNSITEALRDPQVEHQALVMSAGSGFGYGSYDTVGCPIVIDGSRPASRGYAGPVGRDDAEWEKG